MCGADKLNFEGMDRLEIMIEINNKGTTVNIDGSIVKIHEIWGPEYAIFPKLEEKHPHIKTKSHLSLSLSLSPQFLEFIIYYKSHSDEQHMTKKKLHRHVSLYLSSLPPQKSPIPNSIISFLLSLSQSQFEVNCFYDLMFWWFVDFSFLCSCPDFPLPMLGFPIMFVVCLADGVCDLIEIQVIEADCSLRRLHLGMLLVLWLVFDVKWVNFMAVKSVETSLWRLLRVLWQPVVDHLIQF